MSEFSTDLAALLVKHGKTRPRFAYGAGPFDGRVFYGGPHFDEKETLAAIECLVDGKWAVNGEKVHRFETEFSRYIGQKESVMVNSGSSANLLAIAAAKKTFGWRDDDEVIVSAVGFPTTVSALMLNGLKPRFVDIEWQTLNLDLDKVVQYLSGFPKDYPLGPKALFLSPVLGNPPDIDRVVELCQHYGLKLLLDGCDSLGTTWREKHLSDYAEVTTCSFYPAHHLTTLQGGMVSSNNEELIETARSMSRWGSACECRGSANYLLPNGVCGKRFSPWLAPACECVVDHRYTYSNVGFNLMPLDLQGAIGIEQLKKVDEIHFNRRQHHAYIEDLFARYIDGIEPVVSHNEADVSWFGVPVVCETGELKRKLVAHLERAAVQTRNLFAGNLTQHAPYQHLADYRDFPLANEVLKRVFWIGCAPFYTGAHLLHIEQALKEFTP